MDEDRGDDRHVAAGGWRRALVGLAIGVAAGIVVALVLPREPRAAVGGGPPPR